MRPASRSAAVLAGLAAALVVLLAAPLASARPLYGVQVNGIQPTDTPAQISAELDQIAALHAGVVRVEVDWSQLEPHVRGQIDAVILADIDRVVSGAAQRGLAVIMFADRTPCWASSAPVKPVCTRKGSNTFEVTRYGPSDPKTYAALASFLAARYAKDLAAFEIWNEPDQSNEKYWAGPDKVARYVALMKAVYGPVKRVAPKVAVLAGAFVGVDGRWLKAMYAAGARGSYDGLSVHFYDLPLAALAQTRAVQRANHDDAPLWLTEYGWTSCAGAGEAVPNDHPCVTRARQATALVDMLRALHATSWVKAAIIYTLSDQTPAYQFGLVDLAGRPKASYDAVQRALGHPLGLPGAATLGLRRSGARVVASGTGSLADTYRVVASVGGRTRYFVNVRTSRFGRYSVALPASVGVRGVRVSVRSNWSSRVIVRRLR